VEQSDLYLAPVMCVYSALIFAAIWLHCSELKTLEQSMTDDVIMLDSLIMS